MSIGLKGGEMIDNSAEIVPVCIDFCTKIKNSVFLDSVRFINLHELFFQSTLINKSTLVLTQDFAFEMTQLASNGLVGGHGSLGSDFGSLCNDFEWIRINFQNRSADV